MRGGQGRTPAGARLGRLGHLRSTGEEHNIPRIIIADSDAATRDVLGSFCDQAGYEVFKADTERDALALIDRHSANAIITRFYMPSPDGFDLVLQVLARHPRPAIVALSEGDRFVSGQSLAMADRLGVDRVLSKPYTADSVLTLLEEVLS